MGRYDLSDTEWRLITPLPNKPRGVPRVDDSRAMNGIFYVHQAGSPLCDLPQRYGPLEDGVSRYNRWALQPDPISWHGTSSQPSTWHRPVSTSEL